MSKKSKSYSTPNSCSTPRVTIGKDFEFANTLFSSGVVKDNTQRVVMLNNEESPLMKPAMPKAEKNIPNNDSTPAINSAVNMLNSVTPVLDNLNRNLQFDEENSIQEYKNKAMREMLQTVEEDDEELLAHMTMYEVESRNNSTLNDLSMKMYENSILN